MTAKLHCREGPADWPAVWLTQGVNHYRKKPALYHQVTLEKSDQLRFLGLSNQVPLDLDIPVLGKKTPVVFIGVELRVDQEFRGGG